MKKLLVLALLFVPATAGADKHFNGGKGKKWSCKKDPNVFINHGRGKYTFTGTCKSIYVNGGENRLKIEAVDDLSLNGAENVVDVGTIDSITVMGTDNKVTWRKAKSGDSPRIDSDTPAQTTITQKQ